MVQKAEEEKRQVQNDWLTGQVCHMTAGVELS